MPEMIPSSDKEISLREHLEAQIEGVRRELSLVQKNEQQAVEKAEASMNKRLDSMNEFRVQLKDQAATFATREVLDKVIIDVTDRLDRQERDFRATVSRVASDVSDRIGRLENKSSNLDGRFWSIGAVIVVVNIVIAAVSLLIRG